MEEKRAFGYVCPECGKAVYGERTRFALSASAVVLACQCGKSELTAESDGRVFRVTVPCGVCGEEHRAEISVQRVLEGEGVGLACPKNQQLCCYIGDIYRVQASLRDLELVLEKKKEGGEDAFVDNIIMYEVLSELKDIAGRGGISCSCGSRDYAIGVHGAAVDLQCRACGAKMRIPAATDEDLDRLCCRYTLTIKGGERA